MLRLERDQPPAREDNLDLGKVRGVIVKIAGTDDIRIQVGQCRDPVARFGGENLAVGGGVIEEQGGFECGRSGHGVLRNDWKNASTGNAGA